MPYYLLEGSLLRTRRERLLLPGHLQLCEVQPWEIDSDWSLPNSERTLSVLDIVSKFLSIAKIMSHHSSKNRTIRESDGGHAF